MIKNALSFVGLAAVLSASSLVACGGDDTSDTTTGTGGGGGSTSSTTGSGGDDTTSSSTGTGGSAEVKAYGTLSYNTNTSFARFSKVAIEGDGAGCTETANASGCLAYDCAAEPSAVAYLKAGAISAKLGTQTLALKEDAEDFSQSAAAFAPLTPGETITTTVAGDEVPAFTHSFKVPGAPTFTAPAWLKDGSTAEQTFDTTKAVDLTWTTVDADVVDVTFISAGAAAIQIVICTAEASANKLTVPADIMGKISAADSFGGGVVVGVSRVDETVTSSGVSLKATASHFVQAQAVFE